jgi:ProP effector
MSASTKQADARAAIVLLSELFPRAFFVHEAKRKPLKLGIRDDIIATVNGAIHPHELVSALRMYCNNMAYLAHQRAGTPRIDLDGNPAGAVTSAEAAAAAEKLAARVLKAGAARAKAKLAENSGAQGYGTSIPSRDLAISAAAPTEPKRLGLADLKQLAVVRRQAGAQGE